LTFDQAELLVDVLLFLILDRATRMEFSKVPLLKREELAEKIAPQDWSKLGLCFQSRYNWHRTTADLVARSGLYTPPVDLCKRLIEALANLGVSVAELIAALKHIGLVAIGKNIQDTYHITQKEVYAKLEYLIIVNY
jgi:hypothetical protein